MEGLLRRVYENKKASLALKIISHASVLISVLAFGAILVLSFISDPLRAVCMLLSAGVPFVLVTILRRLVNAPRPYELYDFYEEKPKEKQGQSFPSRHVFSIFVIAVLSFVVSPILAGALLLIGVLLSVSRVLLGIHFVRDVACGALIGAVSGVLGILIIL